MSFFFGSSDSDTRSSSSGGVDPEVLQSAWNYMKDHSFRELQNGRRDKKNDEAAIHFDFFFRTSEKASEFGEEWTTNWAQYINALSESLFDPNTTVANTYTDAVDSMEKVQERWDLFVKTSIESAEDAKVKDDSKTEWRVVHSKLAGQSVLSLEYISSFCKNIVETTKDPTLGNRAFSNVFLSEWLELKGLLVDLLLFARLDFQLRAPLLSGKDLLVENWKDSTNSVQKSMGEAFDAAWNLMKAENYTSSSANELSPDSLLSHYHKQLDFLTPGANSTYREMEIRYFLDIIHAPRKVHTAPLETKGIHKDRLTELKAAGLKGWTLQRLRGLSTLAAFANAPCPCVDAGQTILLKVEDVAAILNSLNGGVYTSYKGSYEAWKLQLRRDQFLYPMNLNEFPALFEPGAEGGLDFRAPFGKEQAQAVPSLNACVSAIDGAIAKIFGDDKDLIPFNKESLMPFADLAPGSGTQGLPMYTLHFRKGAQVCGPLLSETPKAFLNIYKKPDNLAAVPGEGSVLVVAWDEVHYSRLLGWNQMTEGYEAPEGCYYLDADPKGSTLVPGYSVPAQCASDCEYWNRLDWTRFVDKSVRNRGKYTTERILKSRKILERVIAGARDPAATAASLRDRWNPTLFVRVLDPGQCCVFPKSHMGYMIFTLGSASALLERNFLLESMVPSVFLRSTLPISEQADFPAYQPRSYSEGAFAAILKACSSDTKNLLKKWTDKGKGPASDAKLQLSPSFVAGAWGLTRDRDGEIPWITLFEDNPLRNRSTAFKVAEWRLTHEDTGSLVSPAFHDPEWFKAWKDSGFLPQASRDMVLGNFAPAYLVQSLLSVSPAKRTLVSNTVASVAVVGSPIRENGKDSKQEIISTEYVNYQGLWMRGNRVQILEASNLRLEFLQVLNVVYPFKEPAVVVIGKDKNGFPIEESESEQNIAGLVPQLRWLLIRGDQYATSLYDVLVQTGADKRLKDVPELLNGQQFGDLWAPLFKGSSLSMSSEEEKLLLSVYPWEDADLMTALIRGQTTEADTEALKSQSLKLATRFQKTRPVTFRMLLENAAEAAAQKGSPDAKTMLQKLRSDEHWYESEYFFTRKTPGGKTLNPAFLDVLVEVETLLSEGSRDVIRTWLQDSAIPLKEHAVKTTGLPWFQSFPTLSAIGSENLGAFAVASTKEILSGAALAAAARRQALKILPGAVPHEREDRKEERDTILLLAETTWVENQGIDAFIGSFGSASRFQEQLKDNFKHRTVRKAALSSWKANALDREAMGQYPQLKKLEKMGKYATRDPEKAAKKAGSNPLKSFEEDVKEILANLESLTSPDNVDSELKKGQLRPDIRRANVLIDSVFEHVLGLVALVQPRIDAVNASVSSRPSQSAASLETKEQESKKEEEAKQIAESVGLSVIDLLQDKPMISQSRGDALVEAAKRKRREYLSAWVYGADEKEIQQISDILEDKFTRNYLPSKKHL